MSTKKIGLKEAVSIGIGGMVGGGIFAVLGLAAQLSKGATAVTFGIAGMVALVTAWSYSILSVSYPSRGGTVAFIIHGFGESWFTGFCNILLYLSYIVMLSLYSFAFGSYGASFFHSNTIFWKHIFITAIILLLTFLNVLGASVVGKTEKYIVLVKLIILLFFVVMGFSHIKWENMNVQKWASPLQLIAGAMIIFVAYEGFELIANTAEDITNPKKNLPRAFFITVIFVIILYVLIAMVTIGNLSIAKIITAKDYALAAAAKPFLGQTGFTIIAIAALLSTASAINATLYGSSRVAYMAAVHKELPHFFENKIWKKPIEGLLITAVLTIVTANLLDLSNISTIGSSGFLLIFGAVNACLIKKSKNRLEKIIGWTGVIFCLSALAALLWQTAQDSISGLWIVLVLWGGCAVFELCYRIFIKRRKILNTEKLVDNNVLDIEKM